MIFLTALNLVVMLILYVALGAFVVGGIFLVGSRLSETSSRTRKYYR